MSLMIPFDILNKTTDPSLLRIRSSSGGRFGDPDVFIDATTISDAAINEIKVVAENAGDTQTVKAISSIRCAAIINYEHPSEKDSAAIWRVMFNQNKVDASDEFISSLVELFPSIAPRDIKMLLRLALRVSLKREEALTLDTFRRCAMFRAIKMNKAKGDFSINEGLD